MAFSCKTIKVVIEQHNLFKRQLAVNQNLTFSKNIFPERRQNKAFSDEEKLRELITNRPTKGNFKTLNIRDEGRAT